MIIYKNIDIYQFHSLKFHNLAKHVFEVVNVDEIYILRYLFDYFSIDYILIANGTKVMFKDDIIIKPIIYISKKFDELIIKNNKVIVSSGMLLKDLIIKLLNCNLGGFSKLYCIPGSVGGMIYMNASIKDLALSDFVDCIIVLDKNNKIKQYNKKKCNFTYRSSIFKTNKSIILYAILKTIPVNKVLELNIIKNEIIKRFQTQEISKCSCGSLFKNGNNYKAYQLINLLEDEKLKVNNVKISNKHKNFIINDNGSYKDALKLIKTIKDEVYNKTKINLELELNIL